MPKIGIISGRGESQESIEQIVRLLKAVKRRYHSPISVKEIAAGSYELYGFSLTDEARNDIKSCDAVLSGDFSGYDNRIEYTISDILLDLGEDVEYMCINGTGSCGMINMRAVSYFDGGRRGRDGENTPYGRTETRVCSSYTAKNVVRSICREAALRRGKIVFVKDPENEFAADLFEAFFDSCALPMDDVTVTKAALSEVCAGVLERPGCYDTVFASKTASEALRGIYKYIMGDEFTAYQKFGRGIPVYYVESPGESSRDNDIPSLRSHIAALADMFEQEFGMYKEAYGLRTAAQRAFENGFSTHEATEFVDELICEMSKRMTTKIKKRPTKSRYIN